MARLSSYFTAATGDRHATCNLESCRTQIERFERRGVSIVALSVDEPLESVALVERLGITFALASDRGQRIISDFGVQNPVTLELALHAVYIVDEQGEIFYRKVARRRPISNELIDAIDAYRGDYPRLDAINPHRAITVAYPENNFQALLAIARVSELPATIDQEHYRRVREAALQVHSDDALIGFRTLMERSASASLDDLLAVAALLAKQAYYEVDHPALETAAHLAQRLDDVTRLEQSLAGAQAEAREEILEELLDARALLTRTRAVISNRAQDWRLRSLKTSIRSYREVARAVFPSTRGRFNRYE